MKHIDTGQQKTITVRWYDSRTGFLSLPDYEYYRVEENKEWKTTEWVIVKRIPKKKKKKSRS